MDIKSAAIAFRSKMTASRPRIKINAKHIIAASPRAMRDLI
jgi:hypothetical protein